MLNKKYILSIGSALSLILLFIALTALNQQLFSGLKFDLTENKRFTLTEGTRNILDDLAEPIHLVFYFSDQSSQNLPQLRTYASRVREMLNTYKNESNGKIQLTEIDPQPFSEEEDQANLLGIQALPIDQSGDTLFLGLAGSNSTDGTEVIPFFDPSKEQFLEAELSKLIFSLNQFDNPKIGLMSTLNIQGGFDPSTQTMQEPWIFYTQVQQLFDIETVDATSSVIPDDLSLLVIIHPKSLPEESLYAIDQFVMKGGKLLVFADPLSEAELAGADLSNPMAALQESRSSNLSKLFQAWGVNLNTDELIADSQYGLQVASNSGRAIRHAGILGLGQAGINTEELITAQLENINLSSSGYFSVDELEERHVTTLLQSSENAQPIAQQRFLMLRDPADLLRGFTPTGERYPLAIQLEGTLKTAFPDRDVSQYPEHISENNQASVVLVADTDILSDRLWVRKQAFFGQQLLSTFAANGDLIANAIDMLSGSPDLISIRGRAGSKRPFDKVEQLRQEAEAQFRETENRLQQQLSETETKLAELQASKQDGNTLLLSQEQQKELERFQNEKLKIRTELRSVQLGLNQGIEALGMRLKMVNIFLVPALLTLLTLYLAWRRKQKRGEG